MKKTDPTDAAWIDHAALRRLLEVVGGDPNELAELVDDYIEDAPDLAALMVKSAASGDRDAYRIASHTLKSNAHDFGAVRLSELCAAAEAACSSAVDPNHLAAAATEIVHAEQAARQTLAQVSLDDLDSSMGQE